MDHPSAQHQRHPPGHSTERIDQYTLRGAGTCNGKHAVHAPRSEAVVTRVAAIAALRQSLLARQSDLHFLGNTRRLLRQRRHVAEAALQQARARSAACAPAAEPVAADFGFVSAESDLEAGRLTPAAQRRMFAPGERPPAPGLARFKAHCGINTEALIRMHGAAGGVLDMSDKPLRMLMEEYRARIAGLAELREDQICWYLVSTWEVAPGMPLSFGLGLTTAACAASFFVDYLLLQMDAGLLLQEVSMMELADDSAVPKREPGAASTTGVCCQDPAPGQQQHAFAPTACHETHKAAQDAGAPRSPRPGLPVAPGAHVGRCPLASIAQVHTPRPADANDSISAPLPSHGALADDADIGGSAEASAEATAVGFWLGAEEVDESVGSYAAERHPADAAGALWVQHTGPLTDVEPGAEPQLRCGVGDSRHLGPAVTAVVEALARRFARRLPRERIVGVLDMMLAALASGAAGDDDAGGVDDAAGGEAAGDDEPMDHGAGGDPGSGDTLREHHVLGLTAATRALGEAIVHTKALLHKEPEPQQQAGSDQHAADMQLLERRIHDFTVGLVGLTVFCPDAFFTLGLQIAFPANQDFCEVGNMQMRLYNALRVPPSQEALMAGLWKDWERNRSTLALSLTEVQLPMSVWSPHATDMPPTLAALAAAVAAGGSMFRLRTLPERSLLKNDHLGGCCAPLLQGSGGADTPEMLPQRRFCAEDGRQLMDSPAAWVMSWDLCAAAPGLLGQCPVATIAAAETLRRLHTMQDTSLRLYQDMQTQIGFPGHMLTGRQVMKLLWVPVQHCITCVDVLSLCQLAHQQLLHDELFSTMDAMAI